VGFVTGSEPPEDSEAKPGTRTVPRHQDAKDAALDAVEPARLLEGEDEGTNYVDDAVHWTRVYSELLDFKRDLLSVAEQRLPLMDDDAGSEVAETDLKVLMAEATRFEQRLEFWQERTRQLKAGSVTNPE
jgi:hypothetical protein